MNKPFPRPAPMGWRTAPGPSAAALLVGLILVLAPAVAIAQGAKPHPALVKNEQAAARNMDALAKLERQAQQTLDAAATVSNDARESLKDWQRYLRADQDLRTQLDKASACLPELQAGLSATNGALASVQQTLAQSHKAVLLIAQADDSTLPGAAQAADAAFAQRSAAEQGLGREQEVLREKTIACASLTRSAQWAYQGSDQVAHQFVDQTRHLVAQHRALHQRWQSTASVFMAAAQAGTLSTSAPAEVPTSSDLVNALAQALDGLTRFAPNAGVLATPAGALTPSRANLAQLWTELARLQDAAAYIDANTTSATERCSGSACAAFEAERSGLTQRIAQVQTRLRDALDQWQQAPDSLDSQLGTSKSDRQALANELEPAAAALDPAVTHILAETRAITNASRPLQLAAQDAHEKSRREWQAAYRLAYGKPPNETVANGKGRTLDQLATAEESMAMMAPGAGPGIRSHAFALFSSFDEEITGFGAYTYVLVRSASDMKAPAVRRRFDQLLTALQKLPDATLVPHEQAQNVNVFCIPVEPGGEFVSGPSGVRYASDLGQQLKMRAQNGLLTQKAVRHRLTNAPGPFLVTLPTRLSQAQSASPVLIADLSTYPADAIADLATHYMNGLVDDFPRQQALWKPPVLQRVALFMIHLAEGTGQLVTSAMPTAQAQPR